MTIFPKEFKCVFMCEIAKDAWDILENTHEATKNVKNSMLQMLTIRFEEIMMEDNESFNEVYAHFE